MIMVESICIGLFVGSPHPGMGSNRDNMGLGGRGRGRYIVDGYEVNSYEGLLFLA